MSRLIGRRFDGKAIAVNDPSATVDREIENNLVSEISFFFDELIYDERLRGAI